MGELIFGGKGVKDMGGGWMERLEGGSGKGEQYFGSLFREITDMFLKFPLQIWFFEVS